MSNIAELANCPELSFIESMTLQETEEQLRELYTKYYREATGKEPEIGEADPLNLLMKAFCAMEYQTMQYADAKGRMEMLKTSTGDALDALAALVGLTRKEANRATATVRFTLSEAQNGATAIPTGTRVKSEDGKYFNTVEYGEIAVGETYTDVVVQAEEAGADSNGILTGGIKILVDPIAYVASVSNTTPSTGGLDAEDDDSLTRRIYLAPSVYSCAGPRDAYEYYAREWRGDVADVRIVSPKPDEVNIYFVIEDENGLRVPNSTELDGNGGLSGRRDHPPAVRQGDGAGPGRGGIRHHREILDRGKRPAKRERDTKPHRGGGGGLPEMAKKAGTGHQPHGANCPAAGGGGKASDADSPGGYRGRGHRAAEMHRSDRDLWRAGG